MENGIPTKYIQVCACSMLLFLSQEKQFSPSTTIKSLLQPNQKLSQNLANKNSSQYLPLPSPCIKKAIKSSSGNTHPHKTEPPSSPTGFLRTKQKSTPGWKTEPLQRVFNVDVCLAFGISGNRGGNAADEEMVTNLDAILHLAPQWYRRPEGRWLRGSWKLRGKKLQSVLYNIII